MVFVLSGAGPTTSLLDLVRSAAAPQLAAKILPLPFDKRSLVPSSMGLREIKYLKTDSFPQFLFC